MPRNEILINILSIVCNVFEAHTVVLYLPDGQHGFSLSNFFSLGDNVSAIGSPLQKKSLAGIIVGKNEPLFINNMDRKGVTTLGYYNSREDAKVKAFMGTPLDQSLGVICLDSKRTYSFSTKDLKILSQFGKMITSMLSCIRSVDADGKKNEYFMTLKLLHDLRKRQPKWDSFLSNLLTMTAGASGFSHAFLTVIDQRGTSFYIEGESQPILHKGGSKSAIFPLGSGLVGWVYKNNDPIFMEENSAGQASTSLLGASAATKDFMSIICLPLVFQRKTRGVLVLAHEKHTRIDEDLKDFLFMVSEYLNQFLENLFLKSRLAEARTALQKVTPAKSNPVLINDN
ncbi:GAF domain-containing protein [Maridesulfovibrio hydrothermalis]|uniref:Putative phytochrome sensor protein n=1 Tax=Maridesulfovibrio hydrothermalis AM13 = DSM 14728 TaxID=1121451 RepID=L0RCW0_9BACT|nr:GAF domain-containing protein [Maridesulfovibrio hydrothermalis]CCO24589.1 putative phytochrome sensor protein [Maridesulfovibrio hydrothermalis AM13 = DSM 14728]